MTRGDGVSGDGRAILGVCRVVHADTVITRLDIDSNSVGTFTIVAVDCKKCKRSTADALLRLNPRAQYSVTFFFLTSQISVTD